MSDFHDIRFPLHLAFGTNGGPQRFTDIVSMASGAEARNTSKQHSRRIYNASLGIKTYVQATEIISFFEGRLGRLHAFRFKDQLDFCSIEAGEDTSPFDQVIGEGDGEETVFQLQKTYGDAAGRYRRMITKPVNGTVEIAVNGTFISDAEFSLDALTGQVTLTSPPPIGAVITAGFEFDVPVRFNTDIINISLDDFAAVQIAEVPLIEVLDYAP